MIAGSMFLLAPEAESRMIAAAARTAQVQEIVAQLQAERDAEEQMAAEKAKAEKAPQSNFDRSDDWFFQASETTTETATSLFCPPHLVEEAKGDVAGDYTTTCPPPTTADLPQPNFSVTANETFPFYFLNNTNVTDAAGFNNTISATNPLTAMYDCLDECLKTYDFGTEGNGDCREPALCVDCDSEADSLF